MIVAILLLPVLPDEVWEPSADGTPTWQIITLLTVCVGLPFFLLSSSAPLIQVWWQRTGGGQPYRLYALSNAGSLLALITYPFIIEPMLWTSTQGALWSLAFIILGIMLIVGVCYASRGAVANASEPTSMRGFRLDDTRVDRKATRNKKHGAQAWRPTRSARMAWLFLSAMGVVLLLATTNHVCQDMAVVPLLWIAPLVVYLTTYIICFGKSISYRRSWYCGLVIVSTFGCAVLYHVQNAPNFAIAIAINLTALFACCMLCHGELVRIKPPPEHLTSFYLHSSAGGAIGGILVSLLAPTIFTDYYEYPLVWVVCWLIMFAVLFRSNSSKLQRGRPLWVWSLLILSFFFCAGLFSNGVVLRNNHALLRIRNFYGVLTVMERINKDGTDGRVVLMHGAIKHGHQYVAQSRRYEPTTYYTRDSGVGYAIEAKSDAPNRHIGVVGLGVGTIAAYARDGDRYRFYEINPHVITLANVFFDYLDHATKAGAEIEIVQGDARLSLENEPYQAFDILVLDAFSSDSVPVHLLTVEAFGKYLRHLKEDGIIAMHISNRYLDLVPLAAALARKHSLDWLSVVRRKPDGKQGSSWILFARPGGLDAIGTRKNVMATSNVPQIEPWTDHYSNLLRLFR